MMLKLKTVLRLRRRHDRRHTHTFDGQFLDQKREDVYVELHQLGFVR